MHRDNFLILADDQGQAYMEQIPRSKYDLRVDGSIGPGERSKSFTSGPARSLLDPQSFDIILPIKSPNKTIKAEDVAKRLESLCGAGAHQQVPLFGHACCVPSANHCTKRALIYLDKGAPTTGCAARARRAASEHFGPDLLRHHCRQ